MTNDQIQQWRADRARQARMGTGVFQGRRGDHLRRLNNGIALRTFHSIRGVDARVPEGRGTWAR